MTACEPTEFNSLLDRYESEPSASTRRLLRDCAAGGGDQFLAGVRRALIERPVSDGLTFALTLVKCEEILKLIVAVYCESKDAGIALTRKLLSCNAKFDLAVLDCVREQPAGERYDNATLAVLEILDEVADGDKLVAAISRLLKHTSEKVRSRAASFIARRRPHLPWISDLSNEPDARVRANVIESLCEIKADFVPPLLRKHACDENNRVAGNAMLGLYRQGDAKSLQLIEQMSKDPRPLYRRTSLWVIGQTRDARFAATLAAMMCDSDPKVRGQALRSLGRIKDGLKEPRNSAPLQVIAVKRLAGAGFHSLTAAVYSRAGEPVSNIPGTEFFLKSGDEFIRHYEVNERTLQAALHVAFVLCLPEADSERMGDEFENAMGHGFVAQRAQDVVMQSTLTQQAHAGLLQDDPALAVAAVRQALVNVSFGLPNLHIILIGAGSETHVLSAVQAATANVEATVHAIALAPAWKGDGCRSRVAIGGGNCLDIQTADDLAGACNQLYAAIYQSYELTWNGNEGSIELEVRCQHGTGSTLC